MNKTNEVSKHQEKYLEFKKIIDYVFQDDAKFIVDKTYKRVLGKVCSSDISLMKSIIKIIHIICFYRRHLYVERKETKKNGIKVYLSIGVRSDHREYDQQLIKNIKPDIIVKDRASGAGFEKIGSPFWFRLKLLLRFQLYFRSLRLMSSHGVKVWLRVLMEEISQRIDSAWMRQLLERSIIRNDAHLYTISTEGILGAIAELISKFSNIEIDAFQHGVISNSCGFSEERFATSYWHWNERYEDIQIRNSYLRKPSNIKIQPMISPPSLEDAEYYIPENIIYISSPLNLNDNDLDYGCMSLLSRSGAINKISNLFIALHPSKKITDYPELRECSFINLQDSIRLSDIGFIGISSTGLVKMALMGYPVIQISTELDVHDELVFPGIAHIKKEQIRSLSVIELQKLWLQKRRLVDLKKYIYG